VKARKKSAAGGGGKPPAWGRAPGAVRHAITRQPPASPPAVSAGGAKTR